VSIVSQRTVAREGLSVGELIDERPLSCFQMLVVALCSLIILMDGTVPLWVSFFMNLRRVKCHLF
jgi:hypothetical protein